jgi:aspartyl-tRNA(Asn)/glutamyl-tRNA(Gln) amidotransferase subunit A
MDYHWLTIHAAATYIAQGELSRVELTRAYLERIQRLDSQINAFITITSELALDQASQAEAEIARGQYRGALHGIPLALKDLYETRAIRTTAGSLVFKDYLPETNAFAVEALFRAGALLLGKLNMHEIALGLTNENPHYGDCRNPWDVTRITGGSSGGSAAALAAGLCLGSLGSDTGGSIRIPAALCGIVGLKPTRGRVSLRGVIPLSWNLDHAGPMARCVQDVALLLQAIAGYDAQDAASQDAPVGDYVSGLKDGVSSWRVALASDDYFQDVDAGIRQAVDEAASVFTQLGARVEPVEIPGFEQAARANSLMVTADAAVFHHTRLETAADNFGEDVRQRLRYGAAHPLAAYIEARRVQAEFRRQMEQLFTRYDLLLLPASPVAALPLQNTQAVQRSRQLTRFTSAFNLTGLPALVLPCGFVSQDGVRLPIGLQVVAPAWAESRLLRGGYAYEQAAGWLLQHPELG